MDIYYIDGKFVEEDTAKISTKDMTVLRGFGVLDFFATYNKRPFFIKEHVARLEKSARQIGLTLLHSNKEICDIVAQTIGKTPYHTESNLKIVNIGGISSDSVTSQGNGKPGTKTCHVMELFKNYTHAYGRGNII